MAVCDGDLKLPDLPRNLARDDAAAVTEEEKVDDDDDDDEEEEGEVPPIMFVRPRVW